MRVKHISQKINFVFLTFKQHRKITFLLYIFVKFWKKKFQQLRCFIFSYPIKSFKVINTLNFQKRVKIVKLIEIKLQKVQK